MPFEFYAIIFHKKFSCTPIFSQARLAIIFVVRSKVLRASRRATGSCFGLQGSRAAVLVLRPFAFLTLAPSPNLRQIPNHGWQPTSPPSLPGRQLFLER